jgi:hypothetical protein
MKQKTPSQLYWALSLGLIIFAAIYFIKDESEVSESPILKIRKSRLESDLIQNTSQEVQSEETVSTNETAAASTEVVTDNEPLSFADQQKELLNSFKKLIELEVKLPENYNYSISDIDGVAAVSGLNKDGESLSLLAANKMLSPKAVVEIIAKNKQDFPMMAGHEFKINGEPISIPTDKTSGLSKITLMAGGGDKDNYFYGAVCERMDGRGTYLFILKTSQTELQNLEKEIAPFLKSISTK